MKLQTKIKLRNPNQMLPSLLDQQKLGKDHIINRSKNIQNSQPNQLQRMQEKAVRVMNDGYIELSNQISRSSLKRQKTPQETGQTPLHQYPSPLNQKILPNLHYQNEHQSQSSKKGHPLKAGSANPYSNGSNQSSYQNYDSKKFLRHGAWPLPSKTSADWKRDSRQTAGGARSTGPVTSNQNPTTYSMHYQNKSHFEHQENTFNQQLLKTGNNPELNSAHINYSEYLGGTLPARPLNLHRIDAISMPQMKNYRNSQTRSKQSLLHVDTRVLKSNDVTTMTTMRQVGAGEGVSNSAVQSTLKKRNQSRNYYFDTIRNITLAKQSDYPKTKQEHFTIEERNQKKKLAEFEKEIKSSQNDLLDLQKFSMVEGIIQNQKSLTSAMNTSDRRSQLRISNQVTAVDLGQSEQREDTLRYNSPLKNNVNNQTSLVSNFSAASFRVANAQTSLPEYVHDSTQSNKISYPEKNKDISSQKINAKIALTQTSTNKSQFVEETKQNIYQIPIKSTSGFLQMQDIPKPAIPSVNDSNIRPSISFGGGRDPLKAEMPFDGFHSQLQVSEIRTPYVDETSFVQKESNESEIRGPNVHDDSKIKTIQMIEQQRASSPFADNQYQTQLSEHNHFQQSHPQNQFYHTQNILQMVSRDSRSELRTNHRESTLPGLKIKSNLLAHFTPGIQIKAKIAKDISPILLRKYVQSRHDAVMPKKSHQISKSVGKRNSENINSITLPLNLDKTDPAYQTRALSKLENTIERPYRFQKLYQISQMHYQTEQMRQNRLIRQQKKALGIDDQEWLEAERQKRQKIEVSLSSCQLSHPRCKEESEEDDQQQAESLKNQTQQIINEHLSPSQQNKLAEYGINQMVNQVVLNQKKQKQKQIGTLNNKKNDFLISYPPTVLLKILDQKIAERCRIESEIDPEAKAFVEKRLSQVVNLSQLQYDDYSFPIPKEYSQTRNQINCGIKHKMGQYLKARDSRSNPADPKAFTVNLYKNKVFRAQLENSKDLEIQEDTNLQKLGSNLNNQTCNHFETIEVLREQQQIIYDQIMTFKEQVLPNQRPIGKQEVVDKMVQSFYELENLTQAEKDLFKEPQNFKYLLTMPWVRIVKDEDREQLGDLVYEDLKNQEPDPIFRLIKNLEVRKAVKEIYQVFLNSEENNKQQNIKKQLRNQQLYVHDEYLKSLEPSGFELSSSTSQQEIDDKANKVIQGIQVLFKDMSISKYCQPSIIQQVDRQSSFSTKSIIPWEKFTSPRHNITDALEPLICKRRQDDRSTFYKNNALDMEIASVADPTFSLTSKHSFRFDDATLNDYIRCQRNTTRTDFPTLTDRFKVQQEIEMKKAIPIVLTKAPQTVEEIKQQRLSQKKENTLKDEGLCDLDRTFTVFPTVEQLVKSSGSCAVRDIFEMANFHNLLDLNVYSIGIFLKQQNISQFIIRDCTLNDKQLALLFVSVGQHGSFQSLWEISINGRQIQVGKRAIQQIVEIVQAKQILIQKRRRDTRMRISSTNVVDAVSNVATPDNKLQLSKQQSSILPGKPIEQVITCVPLKSLHLSQVCISLPQATQLFEQLLEQQCKQLVEIKLEHLQLSSTETVEALCNFLCAQMNLINLSLRDCQFSIKEITTLLQQIIEAELSATLQELDFSQNTFQSNGNDFAKSKKRAPGEKTPVELLIEIIEHADKLSSLDLRETQLEYVDMLSVAEAVTQNQSIKSFKVTIYDEVDPLMDRFQFKQQFIEKFGIPFDQPKQYDSPTNNRIFEFKRESKPLNGQSSTQNSQVIDFLVQQSESKYNKYPQIEKLEQIKGAIEVYRLLNFSENDFSIAKTLQEIKPLIMQDQIWQINPNQTQMYQQTPCLFFFNRDQQYLSNSEWKQIPVDMQLLQKIGYFKSHSIAPNVPLLITQQTIQPFLPASIFSLFNFLGQESLHFMRNFSDKETMLETLHSFKQTFYDIYLQGLSNQGGNLNYHDKHQVPMNLHGKYSQANSNPLSQMLEALQRVSDGWFDYLQQSVLSEASSRYTQIIGINAEVVELIQKTEGATFQSLESLSSTARKESRRDYSNSFMDKDRSDKSKLQSNNLNDKMNRFFATGAMIAPSEKMQRILVILPENWMLNSISSPSQAHMNLVDREGEVGNHLQSVSSYAMYEWKGIIRKKSHASRKRELLRQEQVV